MLSRIIENALEYTALSLKRKRVGRMYYGSQVADEMVREFVSDYPPYLREARMRWIMDNAGLKESLGGYTGFGGRLEYAIQERVGVEPIKVVTPEQEAICWETFDGQIHKALDLPLEQGAEAMIHAGEALEKCVWGDSIFDRWFRNGNIERG
ncbi:hypothetical protein HY025_03375 [Candidatus Daviesbacteria bacterium]|nr:hypothetical protein [Candidatus Daviesbacteria bacterium]